MTALRLGIIASVIALVMIGAQIFGYDWFIIRFGDFSFPLWILVAIYAVLQFVIWQQTLKRLLITDDEVAKWGDKLTQVTPLIVGQLGQDKTVGELAEEIERSHGIPADLTLRYIYAMREHGRASSTEGSHS